MLQASVVSVLERLSHAIPAMLKKEFWGSGQCRRAGHNSKLSLVLVGSEGATSLPPLLSVEAAGSLGLARTLFMEARPSYGPTLHLLPSAGCYPAFKVGNFCVFQMVFLSFL